MRGQMRERERYIQHLWIPTAGWYGSLNFSAVFTRPDIAKTVSKLSQFLQNPSPTHIDAADRTLEYLVGTKYLAIEYDGNQQDRRIPH